jgi:activator of HSP90 ATPase
MKTRMVRQSGTLQSSPHKVYEALMDSRRHSKLTGAKAKIGRKAGETFTAFDGHIKGYTLEGVPDRKIAQLWRAEHWPKGHYSHLTFSLKRLKKGTRLILIQKDVPNQDYKDICEGWREFYWKPMKGIRKR